jgi:beta-lactamase class A
MQKKNKTFTIVGMFTIFGLGMFVGSSSFFDVKKVIGEGQEFRLGGTGLTNPLLECEVAEGISSRKENFTPQLESFVSVLKKTRQVSEMAVYYRDLNNGPVIGINPDEPFLPASLLKVPVMMAYLSWSEREPSILEKKLLYEKPKNAPYENQTPPPVQLESGKQYSVKKLIEHMIKYSDNEALIILFKELPLKEHQELYKLLGVDSAVISDPTAALSARKYSVFFRILFNSSFLSRTNSEYALNLLSESVFKEGLRAGVPSEVLLAHKFGERKIGNDLQQFHDCGIVYYPGHPYMLCIMTRGNNIPNLKKAIADTSRFVYGEIDKQYSK